MTFSAPKYIDSTRAGGEPMVNTHPSGRLLFSSHAGTTHFFTPGAADAETLAFAQNYTGQAYAYYSDDLGETWNFVDRANPAFDDGVPAQGFSDPEFAIDTAGNVFFSEINLANVATSASTDGGKTYQLKNFFGQTIADRQWMDADTENVYYFVGNSFAGGTSQAPVNLDPAVPPVPPAYDPFAPVGNVGHVLFRTTDGGATFTPAIQDEGNEDGLGDIRVDRRNGTLYEAQYETSSAEDDFRELRIVARRGARSGDLATFTSSTVASGVRMPSHWPTFDIDAAGNMYIVWDESGAGSRPAGIYYSYSTDEGRTWAAPVHVDGANNKTKIWPWLGIGDTGKVALGWFEASVALPGHNAETPGRHTWSLVMAQTLNGLGCPGGGTGPVFTTTVADQKIHTGTICQGGTTCQAFAIDRRLGDYFALDIDKTGAVYAGYSDTEQGGSNSLPGFVRQNGGPSFVEAAAEPVVPEAPLAAVLPLLGAALLAGGVLLNRRRDRAVA